MNQTVKFLADKVTQLTNTINAMISNSKKIHELNTANSDQDKFIAVSDGVNTEKVNYKPSEVSQEEFSNIANLELGAYVEDKTIYIKDAEGNILTTLDLSFLDGNSMTLNYDEVSGNLQLLDFQGEVVSEVPVSSMQPSVNTFTYIITQEDVDAPSEFSMTLPHAPKPSPYNTLHIVGGFVNPTLYKVNGNVLSFDKSDVYNLSLGKRITFIYQY